MRTNQKTTKGDTRGTALITTIAGTTRRGSATIWGAISMGMLMTVGALVVDGAMLFSSHADLQAAADASALAAASGLIEGSDVARARASEYAEKNWAGGEPVTVSGSDVVFGDWDDQMKTFTPLSGADESYADAIKVTARLDEAKGNPLRLAFAQMFGAGEANLAASATAVYRPRDIVLVLDLSGSMNYDSQIRHIRYLGRDAIESNLYQIWTELGSRTWGNMGFDTTYISSSDDNYVKQQLGLTNTPYPFAQGSWNGYINYVQGDRTLNNEGYRKDYGGLTFMNYLLDKRREHTQTPELAYVSAQPITAVKNSVDIFLDFLRDIATDDRVGLSVYTSSNGHALLEHGLTDDIELIRSITSSRQAAHYDPMTNIGAGMQVAREELELNGRPGTLKTMILFTDGQANRPGSTSQARAFVMEEAQRAADDGFPVAAISMGSNAAQDLLSSVADITSGVHFHVPGGQPVADYEQQLREVFEHIAAERPMRLVQ